MSVRPPALPSALRFYNTPFIRELVRIESLIAQRYGRIFSLIAIEIDGFEAIKKELVNKENLLRFLKDVATTIMASTRQCDVVGMINKKDFLLILPETDYFGALVTARRLRGHLKKRYRNKPVRFFLAPVLCPYDGRDFEDLLQKAFSAIKEYRKSLFYTLGLEEKEFSECVESLLEGSLPGGEEWNCLSQFSSTFITRLQDVVLKEIIRTPKAKGLLYLSSLPPKENLFHSFLREVESIEEVRTKIHVIGDGDAGGCPKVHQLKRDKTFPSSPFILFLRRNFAYGFVGKEVDGKVIGFHTMDPFLVEGLIGKLQNHYSKKGLL